MYNDLLKIGPIVLHSYGLLIGIGFLTAVFIAERRAPKNGMNADTVAYFGMYCAITGILGAKLLFVIVNWREFLKAPFSLLGTNGLVVYGGIIGGILCAVIYCKLKKFNFWDYFDLVLPSVAVAQGFGRLGCFMAGCCYGERTEAWYGIAFTHSDYAPNGVKLIPTQLISSAGMFLIAFLLFGYANRAKKAGQVGAVYLILYSVGRFLVEFLRGDLERGSIGSLSTSQFISIFSFIIGVAIWFFRNRSENVRLQAASHGSGKSQADK